MLKQAMIVIGSALLIVGCQSHPEQSGTPSSNATAQDNMFFIDTAQANMMEIQESKAALNESQNDAVKNFAQQMVQDHTQAQDQLRQLAETKGVTLPSQLDSEHQGMVDNVQKQQGAAFDKAYIADQVAAHETTLKAVQHEADTGNDADVKSLAGQLVPTLKRHLSMAQGLQGSYPNAPSNANGM